MSKYKNEKGLDLSIAVWLATDTYQHPPEDGKKHISATGLLKSTRQHILSKRMPKGEGSIAEEISKKTKSKLGTAVHDSVEWSWINNYKQAMTDLGKPKRLIDKIRINPEDPNEPNIVPIYMEQRFNIEVNGWVVSGQFDFVGDGKLEDYKTTGTYTWVNNTKSEDYIAQGSIYRWGRQDIITKDVMAIQYIFTDWQAFKATDPKYPQNDIMSKDYPLKSVAETDRFIKSKLAELDKYEDVPEPQLPLCNKKELWQGNPQYKYYKNPDKRLKATKNFDSPQEANLRFVQDGSIGIIIPTVPEPVACKYCPALEICSQGQGYIKSGALKI